MRARLHTESFQNRTGREDVRRLSRPFWARWSWVGVGGRAVTAVEGDWLWAGFAESLALPRQQFSQLGDLRLYLATATRASKGPRLRRCASRHLQGAARCEVCPQGDRSVSTSSWLTRLWFPCCLGLSAPWACVLPGLVCSLSLCAPRASVLPGPECSLGLCATWACLFPGLVCILDLCAPWACVHPEPVCSQGLNAPWA